MRRIVVVVATIIFFNHHIELSEHGNLHVIYEDHDEKDTLTSKCSSSTAFLCGTLLMGPYYVVITRFIMLVWLCSGDGHDRHITWHDVRVADLSTHQLLIRARQNPNKVNQEKKKSQNQITNAWEDGRRC